MKWIVMLGVLLIPWVVQAQVCTHWAAQNGSGEVCSKEQPCKVAAFWSVQNLPGKVLCLEDGVYTGERSMIIPPFGVKGSADAVITVKAEHDGKVLLDAQHEGFAVFLGWHGGGRGDNQWIVVEGVNARNGDEALYNVSGSDNELRRVIGWNGTSGSSDSNIYRIHGYRSRAVDCAGWGVNSRKIFDGAQAGNLDGAGFKRCWGEWNDYPQGESQPTLTYQLGYNSTNQLLENVIGTWNTTGQESPRPEGVFRMFVQRNAPPYESEGTRVLGSLFYLKAGARYGTDNVFTSESASGFVVRDTAVVVSGGHRGVKPFDFVDCAGCERNVCERCVSVHNGMVSYRGEQSGFATPQWMEGSSVEAATGGVSVFTAVPGLCKRYEGGTLTDVPLWPWPMDERIVQARIASGFAPVRVTDEVTAMLGSIPDMCRGGAPPVEPPQPPVVTEWQCTGVMTTQGVGGSATQQMVTTCVP